MLSFRKTNEQIPRKLTDRWKDGHTLFYSTLPAEVGVQKDLRSTVQKSTMNKKS